MTLHTATAPSTPANTGAGAADPRRIPSHELLSGAREIIVEHRGSQYRLRLTANDKLILTK
jgi:hemin uptake protein HemP